MIKTIHPLADGGRRTPVGARTNHDNNNKKKTNETNSSIIVVINLIINDPQLIEIPNRKHIIITTNTNNLMSIHPLTDGGRRTPVVSIVLEAPIPKRSFGDKTSLYVIYIYIYIYINSDKQQLSHKLYSDGRRESEAPNS